MGRNGIWPNPEIQLQICLGAEFDRILQKWLDVVPAEATAEIRYIPTPYTQNTRKDRYRRPSES